MKQVLSAVAVFLLAGCTLNLNAQETTRSPTTPSTQNAPTPDTQSTPTQSPSTQAPTGQSPETQTPDTMEPSKGTGQQQSAQTFSGKVMKTGDKLVLKDSSTQTSYQLDDQDKAQAYVGKNVKVMATLDANSNTLHVVDISPAENQ